jgi:hypothetical protein
LAAFHWQLQVKCDFHCTDFHETHNGSTGLSANLLYQISTKSVNKYGPYKFRTSFSKLWFVWHSADPDDKSCNCRTLVSNLMISRQRVQPMTLGRRQTDGQVST